jgi:probable HAF family extracellular repeat protein
MIGTDFSTSSGGGAINSSGVVLGGSDTFDYMFEAFVWDGTEITQLGYMSIGYAINNSGEAVGEIYVSGEGMHAFVWSPVTNELEDLGALGGSNSGARDINEAGYVVGYATASSYPDPWVSHAFLWDGSNMQDLGTLGGNSTVALLINNNNQVAGISGTYPSRNAFFWEDGQMTDLGVWEPVAMNDAGVITGYAGDSAVVWNGDSLEDLNQLIAPSLPDRPQLWTGYDINELGQILARGDTPGGNEHAYVLTPISALLDRLLSHVIDLGPGRSLEMKVTAASKYFFAEDLEGICTSLSALVDQLGSISGKKIPSNQATELSQETEVIQAALGCQ